MNPEQIQLNIAVQRLRGFYLHERTLDNYMVCLIYDKDTAHTMAYDAGHATGYKDYSLEKLGYIEGYSAALYDHSLVVKQGK